MSTVTLAFDRFGCDCIAAESATAGICSSEFLRTAARRYLDELGKGRFSRRVPDFARTALASPAVEIGVELEGDDLAALNDEADRQGVPLEQLLAHAALCYVAENGAGRAKLSLVE
jgi:hypothetical protein